MTAAAVAPARNPALRLAGARAVFERDFLVFTSRARFLALRMLVVMLPAGVLATVLATTQTRANIGGSPRLGMAVYTVCEVLVPGLVLLLAPVLAASCISSERAMNTLQIVLASPVSPVAFVFAKFASRLCVVLVLVFATLPLAGLCFLYGGVSGGLFAQFVAFAVGVAVLGTAAGIVASSWSRSVAASALTSYFLAIALPLLHLAVVAIVSIAHKNNRPFDEEEFLLTANPLFVWTKLGLSTLRGGLTDTPGSTFLAWTCGFAAAAIAFGSWRVGRESAHEVALRRGTRAADEMRCENPVLDRGLRGTLLHHPRAKSWLRLAFLLLALVVTLALGTASHDLNSMWPHISFLCVTTAFVVLATMTTASHAIASERETGALDLLLATRLSASDVVRGKFAAALLGMSPIVAIALVYGLVAAALTKLDLVTVAAWIGSVAVLTPFFAAVGLWASATAATAGRAVLRAYALLIGGSVVHAVLTFVVLIAIRSALDSGSKSMMWFVSGASPVFVGGMGVALSADGSWSTEQSTAFVAWILWSAVYAVMTVVVLAATVRTVERRNEAR